MLDLTCPQCNSKLAKSIPNFRFLDVNFDNEPQLGFYLVNSWTNEVTEIRVAKMRTGHGRNKTEDMV